MGNLIDVQTLRQLEKKNLRYINDEISGISRKRAGKGFFYLDPNGVKISNQNILERIEKLVIPPAWENVWISPFGHSHLQATGIDDKGRKQYLYHELWTQICQENKFNRIVTFAEKLPKIRKKVLTDMRGIRLVREKILATIVWLLENTFIRVGNEEYAKDNNSFGLTTLRNRHVKVSFKGVKFEFKGKSGVMHSININHPLVTKTIRRCIELPGFELFKYLDESNNPCPVDSGEVNEYLKDLTHEEISAKDFRTWGATVLSAATLNKYGPWESAASLKDNIYKAVKEVARHLGNTPKVCKNYYIHPKIIESYEKNSLILHFDKLRAKKPALPARLTFDEFAVLKLLKS